MTHDFRERLNFSEGIELTEGILRHIYNSIPGAIEVFRASGSEDRSGTDYWVSRSNNLPMISVDLKNRGFCPIEKFNSDDACIETTSVYLPTVAESGTPANRRGRNWKPQGRREKDGWSIDPTKRTDLIVYTWPAARGRRFWIVYFPILCQAARSNLDTWRSRYQEMPAVNRDYETLSIYPLRREIVEAMKALMVGVA